MTILNRLTRMKFEWLPEDQLRQYEKELWDIFRSTPQVWPWDRAIMNQIEKIKKELWEEIIWRDLPNKNK